MLIHRMLPSGKRLSAYFKPGTMGTHASLKCDLGPESLTGLAEPGTGGMMRAWELSWEAPEDTSENSKSGGGDQGTGL